MAVGIIKSTLDSVSVDIKTLLDSIQYKPGRKDVIIKPNLVAPVPPQRGVTTHPKVMEALIEYLKEFDVNISILESSSVAQDTKKVFKLLGYEEMSKKYNVPLLDANDQPKVKKDWYYGQIEIPEAVFTQEYINVPKMKTHIGTIVSLGMKNQKGLISHATKKTFHLKYELDKAVQELAKVVSPDLTIVDGIIALEGDGPGGAGIPKNMNLLIAGQNIVEVDNTAIKIMGFENYEVPHIPKLDYEIDEVLLKSNDVIQPFIRAKKHNLELENIHYYSCRSCSGCTERLAMGLKRMPEHLALPDMNIIAGIEPKFPDNDLPSICFGNCTRKFAEANNLLFLEGCPPEISLLYDLAKPKK